jgi:alpha-N-arabinofuranosidase
MIVLNATDHSVENMNKRGEVLLGDALDWIEYLTGPATSPWGAKRAANGHPKPYRVPYFQIDNEPMNYKLDGAGYADLVKRWAPKLRAAAPGSKIIACGQKRDPDMAFSKQVIDGAGAHFDILGVHNYEYTESAYATGVRRIGNYLKALRDHIRQSARPDLKIGVLEWGMSVGKSSMDWRSGLHAAGSLLLYESLCEDIVMTCPAVFIRQKGYSRWGYGASLMYDQTTWWPSGGYAVGQLFRDHFQPVRLAYMAGEVDALASRSADGKTIVIKAVNYTPAARDFRISFTGQGAPAKATVKVSAMAAPLTAECTAEKKDWFQPRVVEIPFVNGFTHALPPYGVVVFEVAGKGE